jgi:salicylate biosynthesis isochorismate synthase/menaquinone-specific isochorismate synthase
MTWDIEQLLLDVLVHDGVAHAQRVGHPVLLSVTESVAASDPLPLFLAGQAEQQPAFFWHDPARQQTIAALGSAIHLKQTGPQRFAHARRQWRSLLDTALIEGDVTLPGSGPTLLGGMAFDATTPRTALWHGFDDLSLMLPRLQLTVVGDQARLTYNLLLSPEAGTQQFHELMLFADQMQMYAQHRLQQSEPARLAPHGHLPRATWEAIVANAIAQMQQRAFEKVVLARALQASADQPFALGPTIDQLRQIANFGYVFAVSRGGRTFLGATPERLVSMNRGVAYATGLAGTIRRGASAAEDTALANELLNSAKDQREHAVVVDMLRQVFSTVCDQVSAPSTPEILQLRTLQHLYTPVQGRLRNGHSLLDLVEQLHPTPAVGGVPRAAALDFIRTHEQLDRGWYASPVGWLDAHHEGEFAVALRCALVDHDQATLFAGGGILASSDPAREYAETELKTQTMLNSLHVTR